MLNMSELSDSRSRSRSPVNDDIQVARRNFKNNERSRNPGKKSTPECRVYVSNIPYELKWQDLKDLFRTEVGNVAYVEMFSDDTGRPKGSAVIDFDNPKMADDAVNVMHRKEAKGRKLVVKTRDDVIHSRDFSTLFNNGNSASNNRDMGRRGPSRNDSFPQNGSQNINFGNTYGLSIQFIESLGINSPLVSKVFVSNLDYKVTDDELKQVFAIAGKVIAVDVLKDEEGKSKGFAVVEYEHPVQSVQAISMLHNQIYLSRKLSVRLDRVQEKRKNDGGGGGGASNLPPGLKGLGMGLGLNGQAITDVAALPTPSVGTSNAGGGANFNSGFNIPSNNGIASGLTNQSSNSMPMMNMDHLSTMALASLGANLGGALNANPNLMNLASLNQGNSNHFSNPNMAMANRGSNSNNPFGSSTGAFNSNSSGFTNSNNSGFTNQQSSSNSSYNNSARNVVQICNLPVDYNWKDLKDMCRSYGDIRFAEIKSKGVGWVRFASEREAETAAEVLNRQRFDGQMLSTCVV